MKAPCYMCEKRHLACHDNCYEYQTWKQNDLELKRKDKSESGINAIDIRCVKLGKAFYGHRMNRKKSW